MGKYDNWRHGLCECTSGCQCEQEKGPAAYLVARDGKRFNVCTRCILPGDTTLQVLPTKEDPANVLMQYDMLGMMMVATDLMKEDPSLGQDSEPN